jgi:peptide/nickel transport system substrate-binding protein
MLAALSAGALLVPRLARAAQAAGGTAILAIDGDPPTLNLGLTTDYAAGDVGAKLLEGLVWLDRSYTPRPSLATAWTVAPDGKTYTFTLRQGVTWHDGQPFTGADVVFTFTEILAKLHPRTAAMLKRVGATLAAPDDHTVVVSLQQPFAPFLEQMTVFDAPILPKHVYAGSDIAANPANQHPIGTGPFRFASWDRGTAIKVVKNPQYWGAPLPYLDSIVFQIVPQPANRVTGLESGDIDEVVDFYLPKPDEPRLLADPNLQHRQGINIPAIYFAMFNTTRPPFADARVRQAMAFAIDRNRLVQQVMKGLASPGYGAFGDGFGWLLDEDDSYAKQYPLDPARARALLDAAGFKPGTSVALLYDAARPQMIATGQIIRENLNAVGMEIELTPLERSVLNDRVFTRRDFDMTLQSYFSAGDPAIGYHRLYLTDTHHAQLTNASGYSDAQVDTLLGEAATEPDRDKRAALYRQLQKLLNTALPSLVLFDEKTVDFATKKFSGLWPALDARDQWAGVSLAS